MRICDLDSMAVCVDSISGNGYFFMQDSIVYFADKQSAYVVGISVDNSKVVSRDFGKGPAPGELPGGLMDCTGVAGNDSLWFAMDAFGQGIVYNHVTKEIQKKLPMNFGWGKILDVDFDSPAFYTTMSMTNFELNILAINDSTYIFPVNPLGRTLGKHVSETYKKGHIFGLLDVNTMKVDSVFGRYPEQYKKHPAAHYNFFQYTVDNDTIYVCHAADPLIYVYKYPDKLLRTIGFDTENANRSYFEGYEPDYNEYERDLTNVTVNTGLKYIDHSGLLFRTMLPSGFNMDAAKVLLQAYLNDNIVLESAMPDFFRFLGYYNGRYYGAKFIPEELDNGKTILTIYSFKIDS